MLDSNSRLIRIIKNILLMLFLTLIVSESNYGNRLYGKRRASTLRRQHSKPPRLRAHLYYQNRTTRSPPATVTHKVCIDVGTNTLKARHKSCFLRPDTGPCRADILQWYFDVRENRCYRFYWGGCQGNGNRFGKWSECHEHCHLNLSNIPDVRPHFCEETYDYGTCFGSYHRWTFDPHFQSCRRRIYSGCGGNQNNFETRDECQKTCVNPPNNTMRDGLKLTTCIPLNLAEFQ